MHKVSGNRIVIVAAIMIMVTAFLLSSYGKGSVSAQVAAVDYTYTTDEDFDLGTLVSVNHDAPFNDQLQLDKPTEPFPFINIAASGRGTVVRSNTETGEIVGEYRTAPEGRGLNPSRTTVDLFGNVWTANRNEVGWIDGVAHGSAVKIGLIVGGTRVDATGTPDPAGDYLAPPFGYSTCIDRDGDGLIRTSKGLGDVLDWPDISDGLGGADGLVEDAADECILIYQRLYDAEQARHVSVDADNNVWVGGYPFELRMFYKLDGATGAVLDAFDAREIGCGGYGGLIDGNGILWSVGGALLRYDPVTKAGFCINEYGYGLGIDTNGYVWMSIWDGGIVKIAPDGTVVSGFPKHTYPPSMTTSSMAPTVSDLAMAPQLQLQMAASNAVQSTDATPAFQVAPVDDWLQSSSPWTPGATISLTIEDGSGVVYAGSSTADGDGNFQFNLWDIFDLQRGHIVTVSDGVSTKTHTVMDLYVDGVDLAADTVFGRADAGTDVDVWVHGDGGMTVTADGSGNWTADFSGQTDLTYFSDGGTQQLDGDGDATGVWWAAPRIQVAPDDEWVQSAQPWTPGATVTLVIEDGSGVVYSDSQTADGDGRFFFNLWDVFDLQRGHVVTVSDGTNTKTHTVTNLFVDGVDVTADTLFGRADAGTSVEAWVHDGGWLEVTADGSGNWTADFSGMTDITYLSDGGSQQLDGDGDATGIWWASPKIELSPDDDWVQSWSRWTPGATISLVIEDGSGVVYSDATTADAHGNFHFSLQQAFDLQRGHVVTVSDGTNTKTHTVTNLYVDGADVTADTVFGRADPGTEVEVWVHDDGQLTVTADGSGNWTADFSGMTDITYASDGGSRQVDGDGDSTGAWWSSPKIEVAPDDDWIQAWSRWTPGALISLTIEDGTGVLYADSTTADGNGYFNFDLWDVFDLQRGHLVTVSDGTATKTHTVIDLFVDGVDVTADTVFGRAPAGEEVEVWVHGDGNVGTTSDGSGSWTADFSGLTDLTYLSDGGSRVVDDDGDTTGVWWATPSFQVAPDDDWVGSWNRWTAGATIYLVIEDGSGVLYSDSQTADDHGSFNFGLGGIIDLQPGHLVTVSDGMTTKTHTVTSVEVTDINSVADQVSGTAQAGATVRVWASLFDDGSGRWVTADVAGNWLVDFSVAADGQPAYDITGATRITANEYDDDGDSTSRQFGPPVQANRGVAVTPLDNQVWVANSGVGTVTRLDNDGNVLKVINTGDEPTGVAVDAAGKVWATNLGSDNAVRIDPNAGADGLGAVDLTVDLGPWANPYNYSDMTGAVVVGSTSPQGFWSVVQDGGTPGFEWGRINWNSEPEGYVPDGAAIVVEARAADTEAGLGGQTFVPVDNDVLFSLFGRYIEVRATLKASPEGASPVLSDLRVRPAVVYVDIDIKPGGDPNSINCLNERESITVAILTTGDFDALTVDHTSVLFEGASEFHKARGEPIRHEEDVDLDGDLDLVFHFRLGDTALTCASVEGTLTGRTHDGFDIEGVDSVRMVRLPQIQCVDALGCVTYEADEPIRLGSALAISGPVAVLGIDSQRGVEIALDLHGDLFGHPLQLLVEDSLCTPEGGTAAAETLISDPSIIAIVGTNCSSAAFTAAPVVSEAGYVMVSPSNTSQFLTDPEFHSAGYLRTAHNDKLQALAIAYVLRNLVGAGTAAVIAESDPYTQGLGQVFEQSFTDTGGVILASETVTWGEPASVTAALDNIAAEGPPHVLYLPAFAETAAEIVIQARSRPEFDDTILASVDSVAHPDFLAAVGEAAEGILISVPDFDVAANAVYADLHSAYVATYGEEPLSIYHAYAFDATKMILAAIEVSATVDDGVVTVGRQALRDALYATADMEGATGTITCDPFGDCSATQIIVLTVSGGAFIPFWP